MNEEKRKVIGLRELNYYHKELMKLLKGLFDKKVDVREGYDLISNEDYEKIQGLMADPASSIGMVGATADADGKAGVVPTPIAGDHVKFLRGDGTWADILLDDVKTADNKPLADVISDTVAEEVSKINHLGFKVVSALPAVAEADAYTIYLVPGADAAEKNSYDEYILVGEGWELIGNTNKAFELDFATDDEIASLFEEEEEEVEETFPQ